MKSQILFSLVGFMIFAFVSKCIGDPSSILSHKPPVIEKWHVTTYIKTRFATTEVTSRVSNPDEDDREAVFDVNLPETAFITKFVMMIDDREYVANIEEKAAAQLLYNRTKARGQSAGHITKTPRGSNKFKVHVNVAAQDSVSFLLVYQELLVRKLGLYNHVIYIDPGQVVPDLKVNVTIKESRSITGLHIPSITEGPLSGNLAEKVNSGEHVNDTILGMTLIRPSSSRVALIYEPNEALQRESSSSGLSSELRIQYDIYRDQDRGDIAVSDGYFVHFFAPTYLESYPKDVVFVLDVSGSMKGQKLQQLKDAMGRIIEDMGESDRFTLIAFSNSLNVWSESLRTVNQVDNLREAQSFLENLEASGSTDIFIAMAHSIRLLARESQEENRLKLVMFLTDGRGRMTMAEFLEAIREMNRQSQIAIFGLAFGKDADLDLMRKISLQNYGMYREIFADQEASTQISGFYDEISVALLKNVSFQYTGPANSKPLSLTKSSFRAYFEGTELVVAGKMGAESATDLTVTVTAKGAEGDMEFDPPFQSDAPAEGQEEEEEEYVDPVTTRKITEKMWAYLSIKDLLADLEKTDVQSQKESIKNKILDLALQYKFVTPVTSMVVTKPNEVLSDDPLVGSVPAGEESGYSPPLADSGQPNSGSARTPGGYAGNGGYGRPRGNGGYSAGGDPHFMVSIPGVQYPICFDIQAPSEKILNILRDPKNGIIVNAAVIPSNNGKHNNHTYMGEIFVKIQKNVIVITPHRVIINSQFQDWTDETPTVIGHLLLMTSDNGHVLHIKYKSNIEITIRRNLRANVTEHLNVLITDNKGLSKESTGVLGQFVSKHIFVRRIEENDGRETAFFKARQGNLVTHFRAHLNVKHDFVDEVYTSCWNTHSRLKGLIVGKVEDYYRPKFFEKH